MQKTNTGSLVSIHRTPTLTWFTLFPWTLSSPSLNNRPKVVCCAPVKMSATLIIKVTKIMRGFLISAHQRKILVLIIISFWDYILTPSLHCSQADNSAVCWDCSVWIYVHLQMDSRGSQWRDLMRHVETIQPEGAEALETQNNGFHTMRQARGVWLPWAVCRNNAAKWAEPSPQALPLLPQRTPAAPAPHPQVCSGQP